MSDAKRRYRDRNGSVWEEIRPEWLVHVEWSDGEPTYNATEEYRSHIDAAVGPLTAIPAEAPTANAIAGALDDVRQEISDARWFMSEGSAELRVFDLLEAIFDRAAKRAAGDAP